MQKELWSREKLESALRTVLTFPGLDSPRYAIVIPVVHGAGHTDILVEVRAAGISQAGDPCFPGGHIDPGETPAEAAVRELYEELNISISASRLLGQLPTVHTPLGSRTDVFVCVLSPEETSAAAFSRAEVDELMQIPLSYFLKNPHDSSFTYGGNCIWGMTAGAIRHLCRVWKQLEDI